MPTELLFHLDTFFFFWHALFVEDNRNITASFLYINLLPFLTDRVLGIPEIKLKVILDQLVGHCEICIIYAVPQVTPIKCFTRKRNHLTVMKSCSSTTNNIRR